MLPRTHQAWPVWVLLLWSTKPLPKYTNQASEKSSAFVVATIVSEYRMMVRCRELQLRDIRTTKILRLPCRQYLKSVWT